MSQEALSSMNLVITVIFMIIAVLSFFVGLYMAIFLGYKMLKKRKYLKLLNKEDKGVISNLQVISYSNGIPYLIKYKDKSGKTISRFI